LQGFGFFNLVDPQPLMAMMQEQGWKSPTNPRRLVANLAWGGKESA